MIINESIIKINEKIYVNIIESIRKEIKNECRKKMKYELK
jgi:hypothetical protein